MDNFFTWLFGCLAGMFIAAFIIILILPDNTIKPISAKQINTSDTFQVTLKYNDNEFTMTQNLAKFSAMGVDSDEILVLANQ